MDIAVASDEAVTTTDEPDMQKKAHMTKIHKTFLLSYSKEK